MESLEVGLCPTETRAALPNESCSMHEEARQAYPKADMGKARPQDRSYEPFPITKRQDSWLHSSDNFTINFDLEQSIWEKIFLEASGRGI